MKKACKEKSTKIYGVYDSMDITWYTESEFDEARTSGKLYADDVVFEIRRRGIVSDQPHIKWEVK